MTKFACCIIFKKKIAKHCLSNFQDHIVWLIILVILYEYQDINPKFISTKIGDLPHLWWLRIKQLINWNEVKESIGKFGNRQLLSQ